MKLLIIIPLLLTTHMAAATENWGTPQTRPLAPTKKKLVKNKSKTSDQTTAIVTPPETEKIEKEIVAVTKYTAPVEVPQPITQLSPQPVAQPIAPPIAEPLVQAAAQPEQVRTVAEAKPVLKFSGFFDFRFTDLTTKDNPATTKPHAESGFGLEDGALYLNYENNKLSAVIDLPFRRAKEIDLNSAATTPQQSTNGNFSVGVDKAQAYLKYKVNPELNFYVGQFDTIYGVELNDSKDRMFAKTGLVYDYTLPVTHSGALLEYVNNGITYKVFAANPNNKGSFGTSTTGDENTEYGAAINYTNENYRAQIGHMQRAILKADSSEKSTRSLTDITLGATIDKFSIDFEYAIVSDASKNTITSLNNTDKEKNGTGALTLINYKLTENNNLGFRYELIKDDPSAVSLKEIQGGGLSLSHRLESELTLKLEVTNVHYKNYNDQKWQDTRSVISALFSF